MTEDKRLISGKGWADGKKSKKEMLKNDTVSHVCYRFGRWFSTTKTEFCLMVF